MFNALCSTLEFNLTQGSPMISSPSRRASASARIQDPELGVSQRRASPEVIGVQVPCRPSDTADSRNAILLSRQCLYRTSTHYILHLHPYTASTNTRRGIYSCANESFWALKAFVQEYNTQLPWTHPQPELQLARYLCVQPGSPCLAGRYSLPQSINYQRTKQPQLRPSQNLRQRPRTASKPASGTPTLRR